MPPRFESEAAVADLEHRIAQARECWRYGEAVEADDPAAAYAYFTTAHDLVIDCPFLHEVAHRRLRRINWRLGHYGELATDMALAMFAPLGVFRLVAFIARTPGRLHAACQRA